MGISCCGLARTEAAVFWEYWSTDGENSISGTFATDDGTVIEDPSGAQLIEFTLSGFQTFRSNGSPVNFTGLSSGMPNASLAPLNVGEWDGENQYDRFLWDSNAQSVVNRETFEVWGWGEVLDRRGQPRYNEIALVYPESGSNSGLYYFWEDPYSQWFQPTETSIIPMTPVPEPALWAVLSGLLVGLGVLKRRCLRFRRGPSWLVKCVLLINLGVGAYQTNAAVFWEYYSTDGVNSISGRFVTEGEYADLEFVSYEVGNVAEFTISQILTFESNGEEIQFSGMPLVDPENGWMEDSVLPAYPSVTENGFSWDREQQVVKWQSERVFHATMFVRGEYGGHALNSISLSFHPEFGPTGKSELCCFTSEPYSQSFVPTLTTIVPVAVPEPSAWTMLMGGGVLVGFGGRRLWPARSRRGRFGRRNWG